MLASCWLHSCVYWLNLKLKLASLLEKLHRPAPKHICWSFLRIHPSSCLSESLQRRHWADISGTSRRPAESSTENKPHPTNHLLSFPSFCFGLHTLHPDHLQATDSADQRCPHTEFKPGCHLLNPLFAVTRWHWQQADKPACETKP